METLMRVSSARVRQLREGKAWSQEHLANCAGVSLRTVQRVEAEGSGSHETVMALASALGVMPADLSAQVAARAVMPWGYAVGIGLGTAGTLVGVAMAAWSVASQHVHGAEAGRAYGMLGLVSGLGFALVGMLAGNLRARRGAPESATADLLGP